MATEDVVAERLSNAANAVVEAERIITEGLTAKANEEPYSEEAMSYAGMVLMACVLARAGMSHEAIERKIFEEDYEMRFTVNGEGLCVTIDWGDDHA